MPQSEPNPDRHKPPPSEVVDSIDLVSPERQRESGLPAPITDDAGTRGHASYDSLTLPAARQVKPETSQHVNKLSSELLDQPFSKLLTVALLTLSIGPAIVFVQWIGAVIQSWPGNVFSRPFDMINAGFTIGAPWLLCPLVVVYFAPFLIASCRGAVRQLQLLVINLVLGWTIVGWLLALRYAVKARQATNDPRHCLQYGLALAAMCTGFDLFCTGLVQGFYVTPGNSGIDPWMLWCGRLLFSCYVAQWILVLHWACTNFCINVHLRHRPKQSIRPREAFIATMVIAAWWSFTAYFRWASSSAAAFLLAGNPPHGILGFVIPLDPHLVATVLDVVQLLAYTTFSVLLGLRLGQSMDRTAMDQTNIVARRISPFLATIMVIAFTGFMSILMPGPSEYWDYHRALNALAIAVAYVQTARLTGISIWQRKTTKWSTDDSISG